VKTKFGLLVFIYFLKTLSCNGQGFSFQQYYSAEDYGAHVQNWAAQKDSLGYIHFGNGDGLLTFDGLHWTSTHIGETGKGHFILPVRQDSIFALGLSDFGYIRPDSIFTIQFQSLSKSFYKPDEQIPSSHEAFQWNEKIYFRHSYGINVYDGQKLNRFPSNFGMFGNSILVGDSLLIGSDQGILSFDLNKEEFRLVEGGDIFAGDYVWFSKKFPGEKVIFGGFENLLILYNGETFEPFETEADSYFEEHDVYDFQIINDSLYAVATLYGGVVLLDEGGEIIKILTERNGLENNQVHDLYLDDENILWLSLQKGIQKVLLDGNFTLYNERQGLNDLIISMAQSENEIWVQTVFGLFRSEILEPEKTLQFVEVDFDESINELFNWNGRNYGLGFSGLYLLEGEQPSKIDIVPGGVRVKKQNSSSILTIYNQNQLVHYDGENIITKPIPEVERVRDAALVGDSLFVLNREEGVFLISNGEKKHIPLENNSNAETFYNTIGSLNGELFIAIEGKNNLTSLYKYHSQEDRFVPQHFLSNFPDVNSGQVFYFKQCQEDELWMIANLKLLRFYEENNQWKVDDSYRLINGNNSNETVFTINCTSNGVYFGGTMGLVHLEESERSYKSTFPTNINRIYTNRDSLIYGGFGDPKENYILPYKNNELRFQYAVASYINPERNLYQVMLEGFDSDWNNWTSETQIDYTNIPEGTYTFKVRSRNAYDVAGIPDSFTFEILPPWYRTWWAYMLYIFSIAGILYTAYKIRVNQLLRVERIRNHIASDLHDEISATLSSISYFAQAIESDNMKGDKSRFLKLISNSAGDAKEKITDIVWAINPEHDDWQGFLSKCRRYASDLLESKGINYSLKIDEYIPGKLDMQLRQHLWLIFKEMITNAARHSEAKQVDVIMKYEEGLFKLVVQDDGKGMDVDGIRKGNGLVNINKRADQIGADINLKTSEGFGTRWMLKVEI
jgi:hypothetical protein